MESPRARRAVSGFSCSTATEGALRTRGSVREVEWGPADPEDDFKDGARVGGKVPPREGLAPVDLPLPNGDEINGGEISAQSVTPNGLRYMELSESRRVRSGDLHYLDHPKFGIIVRIDTIEIPQELESALQIQRNQ